MKSVLKFLFCGLSTLALSSCNNIEEKEPNYAKLSITGANDNLKVLTSDANQVFVNVSSSSSWSIKVEPTKEAQDASWLSLDQKNGDAVSGKDLVATYSVNEGYERSLYLILINKEMSDTILVTQQGKIYSDESIGASRYTRAVSSFKVDFESSDMPKGWESETYSGSRQWQIKRKNNNGVISMSSYKSRETDEVVLYSPKLKIDREKILKFDMSISYPKAGTMLYVLLLNQKKETIRTLVSYDMGASNTTKESFVIEKDSNIKYIGFFYEGNAKHTSTVTLDNIELLDNDGSTSEEEEDNNSNYDPAPKPNPIVPAPKNEHILGDMTRLEIPRLAGGENNWFVSYRLTDGSINYSLEWDSNWKIPRWVAFTFDKTNTAKVHSGRNSKWGWDNIITPAKGINQPWFRGYDRGHMVASNDRQISAEANGQTFYYTNMTPQLGGLNQQFWQALESLVQDWARNSSFNNNVMYVAKGVAFNNNKPTNWNNGGKIAIPDYYYMAIVHKGANNKYNSIGFWVEHKALPKKENKGKYVVSIDEIERRANVDLFPNIPDAIENDVESHNPLQKRFFSL